MEKFEHVVLGCRIDFRCILQGRRKAILGDGDRGSPGILRAEKGQRQQGRYPQHHNVCGRTISALLGRSLEVPENRGLQAV
jgi:hypothetical protein